MDEPLTMKQLLDAANEMSYRNLPVEARLTQFTLWRMKLQFAPNPLHPPPPQPDAFRMLSGIQLVVDPTIPPNRLEFRDADGNVVQTIDLPEIEFELPKPAPDPIAFEAAFKLRWWRRHWP